MKLFLLKRISLIFSLLLLSFSFLTIGVGDVKAQATCSIDPSLISTTQPITFSFSNPHLPTVDVYGINISIYYLSDRVWGAQFNIDASGNYSASEGPFAWQEEGHYRVEFTLSYAHPPDEVYQCITTFEVNNNPDEDGAGANPCPGGVCQTALGEISSDPGQFVGRILTLAIGVAGGLALILMVIGSIRVLTSSGDPQRVAGGRDMIVAAVAGLLFLILSVLILRFIGVHIVGLQ